MDSEEIGAVVDAQARNPESPDLPGLAERLDRLRAKQPARRADQPSKEKSHRRELEWRNRPGRGGEERQKGPRYNGGKTNQRGKRLGHGRPNGECTWSMRMHWAYDMPTSSRSSLRCSCWQAATRAASRLVADSSPGSSSWRSHSSPSSRACDERSSQKTSRRP